MIKAEVGKEITSAYEEGGVDVIVPALPHRQFGSLVVEYTAEDGEAVGKYRCLVEGKLDGQPFPIRVEAPVSAGTQMTITLPVWGASQIG